MSCHQEFFTCSVHIYIFINISDQSKVIDASPSNHMAKSLCLLMCCFHLAHWPSPQATPLARLDVRKWGKGFGFQIQKWDWQIMPSVDWWVCAFLKPCSPLKSCSISRDCLGGVLNLFIYWGILDFQEWRGRATFGQDISKCLCTLNSKTANKIISAVTWLREVSKMNVYL